MQFPKGATFHWETWETIEAKKGNIPLRHEKAGSTLLEIIPVRAAIWGSSNFEREELTFDPEGIAKKTVGRPKEHWRHWSVSDTMFTVGQNHIGTMWIEETYTGNGTIFYYAEKILPLVAQRLTRQEITHPSLVSFRWNNIEGKLRWLDPTGHRKTKIPALEPIQEREENGDILKILKTIIQAAEDQMRQATTELE